jgi:Thioredoxin domain
VVLAHQFAMESPFVEAEAVDAGEFMILATELGVGGVPHTAINAGAGTLVGAAPEDYLVREITNALNLN